MDGIDGECAESLCLLPLWRTGLYHFHFLHPLCDLHIPSQFLAHSIAQLARCLRLTMYKISRARLVLEGAQPFEDLRRIGMIAELLERCHLGADRHHLAVHLHFGCATLD